MTPRLEWSDAARADLAGIIAHIADDNPMAAQSLKDEIGTKVTGLCANPSLYAKSRRAPGYRQITVHANYLVFYRLLPDDDEPHTIDVAAVVHARRNWP